MLKSHLDILPPGSSFLILNKAIEFETLNEDELDSMIEMLEKLKGEKSV